MSERIQSEVDIKKFSVRGYIEVIAIAVFLSLIIKAFVFQAFNIPSTSMENSLKIGDYFLGEKISVKVRPPNRNEVVVFKYPLNPDKFFIKRCLAIAGDTILIRDKVLFVNGIPVDERPGVHFSDPKVLSSIYSNRDNFGPLIVPDGHIFLLGDNRDMSQDSRFWGFLPKNSIVSRPLFVYFSWAPDENAPEYNSVFSLVPMFFYNLVHFPERIRWDRIGKGVSTI
jgi:signal peptidase I